MQGGSVSGRAGSGVFPMRVLRFSLPVSIFLSCCACRFADFIFFWRVDRVGRVRRVCCLPVSYVSLRSLGRVPLRSQGEVSLRSLLICSKSSHIPPSPDMSRHGGICAELVSRDFVLHVGRVACRPCRPKNRVGRVGPKCGSTVSVTSCRHGARFDFFSVSTGLRVMSVAVLTWRRYGSCRDGATL